MTTSKTRIITKPHLGNPPHFEYGWYFEVEHRGGPWDVIGPFQTKELAEESREVIGRAR